ncbi:hypothetical protein MML48_2g00014250 [Holotrichia oblita]|uniref:Uncharacterized protein n=1 Tax=Holotrichia oblita TaxID=644536 RepID=A0ACB9TKW7_HOLOL|nr:hypothetical protein MML48_2g00014250 [Holotrichia oblita]
MDLTSYIPKDEQNKWNEDVKPIINKINKIEEAAKTVGFKQEVIDKYIVRKTANYLFVNLLITDCELEYANNKVNELEYKLDNYNNYDPKKLAELRNKTIVVPSNINEAKERSIKMFERNARQMKSINAKYKSSNN